MDIGIERFENFSVEQVVEPVREVDEVVNNWARAMKLDDRDLLDQATDSVNIFDGKKIDELNPEENINFWVEHGVKYSQNLEGVVLGKTLKNIRSRERIKISSDLAKLAAQKIEGGEQVKNLSKAEQVSMLSLAKAKIVAAQDIALSVYPALKTTFEVGEREIDQKLRQLLVDTSSMKDVSDNFDWDRIIPRGRRELSAVFSVVSLVLAAASVGIANSVAENAKIKIEGAGVATKTAIFDQDLLGDRITTSTPEAIVLSDQERQSQTYLYDTKYGSEIYIYDEPWIQDKLADFKEEYGISIVNPWKSTDYKTGEEALSTPWSAPEVAVLIDEISKIPPMYLDQKYQYFPKTIVLFKIAGSSGSAGGVAQGTDLTFFIPANFDLNNQELESFGLIFGTSEQYLRSVVDHEWTHNHQVSSPEFHTAWELEMGWIQDESGVWTNSQPDKYVIAINGQSALDPQEDQATSIQIFRFDPSKLSEERRNFIIKSFPDWQPVIDYIASSSEG